jgi:hypothetical protein
MLARIETTAAERFRELAWCCAFILSTVITQQPAQAQDKQVCVVSVGADTGRVHDIADFSGGMLIGAEKGLFLARAAGGKVTLTPVRGGPDTGRVLSSLALPGGRALIGAQMGLFLAREEGGTLTLAPVPGTFAEPPHTLYDLPGAGILVATERGLFLAREQNGQITVGPAGYPGQILEVDDFMGRGVLLGTGGEWLLARAASGNATVTMLGGSRIGYVRSIRSFAGGVLITARDGWQLVHEQAGKFTVERFGENVAGSLDALGELPGGVTLIHGKQGWFTARVAAGKVMFAPAGGPETRRVRHTARVGSALLALTEDGWIQAREAGGKVMFTPVADPGTGAEVFQSLDRPGGGVLIAAERGLFVAREAGGKVTLERVGEHGPALIVRALPGDGVLIATSAQWFVVREAGGRFSATPAGPIAIGTVVLNARDLGLQLREFGGALLIGAERGLFVAGPAPAGARGCEGQ